MMLYFSFMRLKSVMHPLEIKSKRTQEIIYQVSSIHLFSFTISLFITLMFQFIELQLPTSLCLPFIDPSGSSILSKVISWIVIMSQTICSVLISGMHILIFQKVKISKELIRKEYSDSIKKILYQLILTSTSNILCWFPTNVIYLSAMFLTTYPINLVIWTTVAVMPINSVINASIFLVTNLKNVLKGYN